jgi:hypothetical protein
MLPGQAPLVPHTMMMTTLTWASTSTQRRMCYHSLRMLSTPRSLHRPCKVDEHGSLRAVSLRDPVPSFIASAVIIIDYLTLVVSLWRGLGQLSWCSELIVVVDKLWTLWTCGVSCVVDDLTCGLVEDLWLVTHGWLVNLWILWFLVLVFFWIFLCGGSQFRWQMVRCSG